MLPPAAAAPPVAGPVEQNEGICGLILVPPEQGKPVPPYLLGSVAGLPLLDRLILSCWRAGVQEVTVLAPEQSQPCLRRRLTRLCRRRGGAARAASSLIGLEAAESRPWLVLSADTLPSPALLARVLLQPLAPGQIAVAAPEPPSPPLAKLTRFSAAAWEDFRQWRQGLGPDPGSRLADVPALVSDYLEYVAQQDRVVPVASDPFDLSLVARPEDLKAAAQRLVASLPGSPWGEGIMEFSLNRRLARLLLLRLATAPVTPNQITLLNLSLGLAAAGLLLTGAYWLTLLGALLLPVVMVLDALDGMLARLTFRETRLGQFLDLYGDTFLNLLIFCSLAVGRYQATGRERYLVLLIPIVTGYLWCWRLTDPLWGQPRPPAPPPPRPVPGPAGHRLVKELSSRDFVYLILLAALWDCLEWFVLGVALGTHLFALTLTWWRRYGAAGE
jgi:phosphatidylglycerophosphate synthase